MLLQPGTAEDVLRWSSLHSKDLTQRRETQSALRRAPQQVRAAAGDFPRGSASRGPNLETPKRVFFLAGMAGGGYHQTLDGPFSAVSKSIFYGEYYRALIVKFFPELYEIYKHLQSSKLKRSARVISFLLPSKSRLESSVLLICARRLDAIKKNAAQSKHEVKLGN